MAENKLSIVPSDISADRTQELRCVFSKAVKKHLRRLFGKSHDVKVIILVGTGDDYCGCVFFPGEVYQGTLIGEGEYIVLVGCRVAMSQEAVSKTAAHEARHIWQHASGALRYIDQAGNAFLWHGKALERAAFSYQALPFEVDARRYAGQEL